MVKHILTYSLVIIIVFILICPCFAIDIAQSDSDYFCFSYDNSKIINFDNILYGDYISSTSNHIDCNKIYLYVPISYIPEKLNVSFSIISDNSNGFLLTDSIDYGQVYSSSYHILGSLNTVSRGWIGRYPIDGTSLSIYSFFINCPLPNVDTYDSTRYIRLCFEPDPDANSLIRIYTFNDVDMGRMQIYYDDTEREWTWENGYIKQIGNTYLNGNYKSYGGYANNGNTQLEKIYTWLDGSTSGTGGYMRFSGLSMEPESTSLPSGSITRTGGRIYGYDDEKQRNYLASVSMKATRSYSDSDLITAVNNASDRNHTDITNFSDRNHTDLVNIGNNLQELVDHQDEVNQAGNDIGSTTSSSSISNTSGNLGSGISGLNSTLSTASDVSSFVSASTPYISFIGAFLPVVLNFGNGVLAWAVVAIIAVTVFLYILKKVSE